MRFVNLGPYRLIKKLGSGGMGEVFLAHDMDLDRRVALKTLHKQHESNPEFAQRFRREAQAVAKLNHPGIVPIYYIGKDQGCTFFAMEYVGDVSLMGLLKENGKFPLADALKYAIQVAEALDYAAQQKIIHRDIKPANLLLNPDGQVKLVDFGLAKNLAVDQSLTMTGMVVGSPLYMSPEQCLEKPVDFRSDIYSLGATLFHLVNGAPPYQRKTTIGLLKAHVDEPIDWSDDMRKLARGEFMRIIGKMMSKKSTERYQNYVELLADLRRLHEHPEGPPREQKPVLPKGDSELSEVSRRFEGIDPADFGIVETVLPSSRMVAEAKPGDATKPQTMIPPSSGAEKKTTKRRGCFLVTLMKFFIALMLTFVISLTGMYFWQQKHGGSGISELAEMLGIDIPLLQHRGSAQDAAQPGAGAAPQEEDGTLDSGGTDSLDDMEPVLDTGDVDDAETERREMQVSAFEQELFQCLLEYDFRGGARACERMIRNDNNPRFRFRMAGLTLVFEHLDAILQQLIEEGNRRTPMTALNAEENREFEIDEFTDEYVLMSVNGGKRERVPWKDLSPHDLHAMFLKVWGMPKVGEEIGRYLFVSIYDVQDSAYEKFPSALLGRTGVGLDRRRRIDSAFEFIARWKEWRKQQTDSPDNPDQ